MQRKTFLTQSGILLTGLPLAGLARPFAKTMNSEALNKLKENKSGRYAISILGAGNDYAMRINT